MCRAQKERRTIDSMREETIHASRWAVPRRHKTKSARYLQERAAYERNPAPHQGLRGRIPGYQLSPGLRLCGRRGAGEEFGRERALFASAGAGFPFYEEQWDMAGRSLSRTASAGQPDPVSYSGYNRYICWTPVGTHS